MIMQEVTHKLQIIKESIKTEKEIFWIEIELVKEQLQKMEAKSVRLKKEMCLIKGKKQKLG